MNCNCSDCHCIDEKEDESVRLVIAKICIAAILMTTGIYLHFFTDINNDIQLIIFGLGFAICAYSIVFECYENIKKGEVFDENLLTLIATMGAFAIGEYPEALAVVLFFTVGELFEDYAVDRSRRSISSLIDLVPEVTNVIRNGKVIETSPKDVSVGEKIIIKPGEKVPLDCVIIEGSTSIDTKALTGESMPRDVNPGSELLSGFVNLSGAITAEVKKPYSESTVSRILELIEISSSKKARSEKFITVFARYYTPTVCFLALLVATIPIALGQDPYTWIYRALTLLVVSCPCALVISIPMGFFCGIGCASKFGILVKGGNYLEMLSKVENVVFDKTGTLTKGSFSVNAIHPSEMSEDELVKLAAEAEFYSNHPISISIKTRYGLDIDPSDIKDSKVVPGKGVITTIKKCDVHIGNKKLMESIGYDPNENCCIGTKVHLASENGYLGHISVYDSLKDDSILTVKELKSMGIKTFMLTGDNKEVAEAIGKESGIDEVHSELLPGDKLKILENIIEHSEGSTTFVGDGINDAPSLARSDVGIAMGGIGSDAAIEAADIVLLKDDPSSVVTAVKISKRTMRIVHENIIFALGVKVIIIILATVGFANMYMAIFGDVGVSIIAILNAMRCLRTKGMDIKAIPEKEFINS